MEGQEVGEQGGVSTLQPPAAGTKNGIFAYLGKNVLPEALHPPQFFPFTGVLSCRNNNENFLLRGGLFVPWKALLQALSWGGGRDVRSTPEAPRKFFSMVGDLTPLASGGEHLERRCIGHKHAPGTGQSMAAFWGGVW